MRASYLQPSSLHYSFFWRKEGAKQVALILLKKSQETTVINLEKEWMFPIHYWQIVGLIVIIFCSIQISRGVPGSVEPLANLGRHRVIEVIFRICFGQKQKFVSYGQNPFYSSDSIRFFILEARFIMSGNFPKFLLHSAGLKILHFEKLNNPGETILIVHF